MKRKKAYCALMMYREFLANGINATFSFDEKSYAGMIPVFYNKKDALKLVGGDERKILTIEKLEK